MARMVDAAERKATGRVRSPWPRTLLLAVSFGGLCLAALALAFRDSTAAPTAIDEPVPDVPSAQVDAARADTAHTDAATTANRDAARAEPTLRDVAPPARWIAPRIAFVDFETGAPAAHLAIRFVPLDGDLDREEDVFPLLEQLASADASRTWRTDQHGIVAPEPWLAERCLAVCADDHHYVVDGDTIRAAGADSASAVHHVTVAQGYAIRGTVRGANGSAVAGARVFSGVGRFTTLLGGKQPGSPDPLSPAAWRVATSGADGTFLLRGMPVSVPTSLTASAAGHAPARLDPAPVGAAGHTVFATLVCPRAVTLSLCVLASNTSSPIPSAIVTVKADVDGPHARPVAVDQDGRVRVVDLPAGPVTVHVRADGFHDLRVPLVVAPDGSEAELQLRPKRARSRAGR